MKLATSLSSFVYRILFAMPLCFGLWYFCASVWTWPVAEIAHGVLRLWVPKLIAGVEHAGRTLDIVTNLGDLKEFTQNNKMSALVFSVNPLEYGYSLALYAALLLAAKNYQGQAWLIGILVLLGVIVFGVCFDVLKSIAFDLAPSGMSYPTGFSAWQLNMIGVGYQLGYLVFPAVMPLMLWANYNKAIFEDFLE